MSDNVINICGRKSERSRNFVLLCLLCVLLVIPLSAAEPARLRVIIETDAGGDPDDEQSMVRFLLYTNEWDVEGIIANRPQARDGENKNTERTGLGIVKRMVNAYGDCFNNLKQNDPRYPESAKLLERTVPGYDSVDDGVQLLLRAVDADDPRPVWFMNWGTDRGAAESCLVRALDRVKRERGHEGYAKFKQRLRLSSSDEFGDHTTKLDPPFPIWVDTFRPELEKKRWYHRFSAITAKAGGFDIERDVRTNHGPLGALYPLNTTHPQKEGDTMSFLYLVPNGLSEPEQPTWGSWAGRYELNPAHPGRNYYHATAKDTLDGKTHREVTLSRWAADLQNDFRARMEWCVKLCAECNHPPAVKLRGELRRSAKGGEEMTLDASESTDPDGQPLSIQWLYYKEAGTYAGDLALENSYSTKTLVKVPAVKEKATLHFIAIVRDNGTPPLTRYARVVVEVSP